MMKCFCRQNLKSFISIIAVALFLGFATSKASANEIFECTTNVNHGPVADGYIVKAKKLTDGSVTFQIQYLMYYLVEELGEFSVTPQTENSFVFHRDNNNSFQLNLVPSGRNGRLKCEFTGILNGRQLQYLLDYRAISGCGDSLK